MPFYSTMAETDIERPALEVYHYITNPANWAENRPVSDPGWTVVPPQGQAAKGAWPHPRDREAASARDWCVLEDEPGRRWIVRCRTFGSGASVTVTYSLAEREGVTHILRHMEIEVPDNAAVSEHARAAFACSKPGNDRVAAIKQVLEDDHGVVVGASRTITVYTPQPR